MSEAERQLQLQRSVSAVRSAARKWAAVGVRTFDQRIYGTQHSTVQVSYTVATYLALDPVSVRQEMILFRTSGCRDFGLRRFARVDHGCGGFRVGEGWLWCPKPQT